MNENWAEVRRQLDQVLESERARSQARRQPSSVGHALGGWWSAALHRMRVWHWSPANAVLSSRPQR